MPLRKDVKSSVSEMEKSATEIALRAGQILKSFPVEDKFVRNKGPVDLVTEADYRSEEFIVSEIETRFPDHSILTEERGGLDKGSSIKWIIDPLDGTTNFAHDFPIFSVSLAVERDGEIVLGVVYEPNLDELYVARKGGGSTLNGKEIKVSFVRDLEGSLLATGFPYFTREEPKKILPLFNILSLQTQGIRRAGSASIDLCFLAAGRFDGYWELGLKAWDTAAGALIVHEAGGKVTNFKGERFDVWVPEILASNGIIHDRMQEIIDVVMTDEINGGNKRGT